MNINIVFLSGYNFPVHIPKYDFDVPVISLSYKLIRKIEEYKHYNSSQFKFYLPEIDLCIDNNNKNITFQEIYDKNDENINIIVYVQSHMDCPDFYQKYIRMMHEDEFHRSFDDSDFTPLLSIEYDEYNKKYYWINYEKGEEYNMVRFYNYDPNRAPDDILMYSSDTLYISNVKETHNTFCDENNCFRQYILNAVYTETAKRRFSNILHQILSDYSENDNVIKSANQFLNLLL